MGKQTGGPGSEFEPFWDKPGAVGFYDYGSLTMVRACNACTACMRVLFYCILCLLRRIRASMRDE